MLLKKEGVSAEFVGMYQLMLSIVYDHISNVFGVKKVFMINKVGISLNNYKVIIRL